MMTKLERPSQIQYSEQVDYLILWIESAPLKIKNEVLEKLLRNSNLNQTNLLWTILQPVCHRDFYYSSKVESSQDSLAEPVDSMPLKPNNNYLAISKSTDNFKNKSIKKQKTKSPNSEDNGSQTKQSNAKNNDRPLINKSGLLMDDYANNENIGAKNVKRWLNDVDFLPHVIRFPKLPIRRHVQENSYLASPIPQDTLSSIVMPNSVQIKEKEVSIAQKTKAKKLDQQFDKQTIAMQTLYNFKSLNEKNDPTKINFDALSIETMKHQIELFLLWYTDMWTDIERNAFLRQLILKLDPKQHYFVFNYLSRRLYRDFISQLPEKISILILQNLTPKELGVAARVCKAWKRISETGVLWESKCRDIVFGNF